VQTYAKVRQAHFREGKSQRELSIEYGLNRRTVQKMLKQSIPPGYQRQKEVVRFKLAEHIVWIDDIIESDKKVHPKQRHTAIRIYNRLKEERSFTGGYTIVREYVAKQRLKSKEMFIPLSHEAGSAQCDFGEAQAIIKGKGVKVHYLVMQLPYSDAFFVKAYESENTESFCDGHASAFKFFGGVPKHILYDNSKIAVKKILGDGKREQTDGFISLKSHYLFSESFANVGRGNEKGGVENLVGYARRNFMVPLPSFESFESLNEYLASCCKQQQSKIKRGHEETIGQRLSQESFLPLPTIGYECCRVQAGKVSSQGLVRFGNNDYSVPTRIGQQKVWIKGYAERVVVVLDNKVIAEHPRSYGKEEICFNPLHYLELLERKSRALEQAAPLKKWSLPNVFQKAYEILYRKDGKEGRRIYVRILRLLETYKMSEVKVALEQAVELEVVDELAIKHLLKRHVEGRPTNLSLLKHPNIPSVHVASPDLRIYTQFLSHRSK